MGASVGLGKRMGIFGTCSSSQAGKKGGRGSMHITRRRQNSFCNALAEREESFGNDYPPTTDEKRDHKFFETVCCYSRVGQGSPFFLFFGGKCKSVASLMGWWDLPASTLSSPFVFCFCFWIQTTRHWGHQRSGANMADEYLKCVGGLFALRMRERGED